MPDLHQQIDHLTDELDAQGIKLREAEAEVARLKSAQTTAILAFAERVTNSMAAREVRIQTARECMTMATERGDGLTAEYIRNYFGI